jgi:hypothetical protein
VNWETPIVLGENSERDEYTTVVATEVRFQAQECLDESGRGIFLAPAVF